VPKQHAFFVFMHGEEVAIICLTGSKNIWGINQIISNNLKSKKL